MNKLSGERRAQIAAFIVEGGSIRGCVRATGAAKRTVTRLVVELGEACAMRMDEDFRNLPLRRLQLDEVWTYVLMKAKTAKAQGREDEDGIGNTWIWIAMDADSRLVPSFLVGQRDEYAATAFLADVRLRVAGRPQITSDGHSPYLVAVERAFGSDADFAQVVKDYAVRADGGDGRYIGAERTVVSGTPDMRHVSTSYIERGNLTLRMASRRLIRRTNGYSRKTENLWAACALHFAWYNYCKPHTTLTKQHRYPTTPAMAAGVTNRVWTMRDLVALLEDHETSK